MKTKNVVTAFVFILAIGGAFASELVDSQTAYSRKADVQGQQADCEQRGTCAGGLVDCSITFDPDGSGPSGNITAAMYDGVGTSCGTRLKQP